MAGDLYIAMGDITRLHAHAVCLSRGHGVFGHKSPNFKRLAEHARVHGAGRNLLGDFANALAARGVRPENPIHWDHAADRAFYLPCGEDRPPYGVAWTIVFARGTEPPGEEPSALALADGVRACLRGLRGRNWSGSPSKRFLVGLVGFGMGKGGARHTQMKAARAQVWAACNALAAEPDLDLAFVLQDSVTYEVFLDARREVFAARGLQGFPPLPPEAAPLAEALRAEEGVLFVGSGLSRNSEVTDYDALIRTMAAELGATAPPAGDIDCYLDVAQRYRDEKSDDAVKDLVGRLYAPDPSGAPRALPSLAHYLLLGMPARFVVTTNYDRLLEDALEALGRHPLRVLDAADVPRTGERDGVCVVKMHGDAVSRPESVVLGREDYDAFFEQRPEMATLLEGLLLNQTFLFLGYALRDPNFRQVFSRIDRVLRRGKRPAFATEFAELNEHVRYRYERDGLRLLDFSASGDEKTRDLLRFLDTLSEAVLAGGERTFLAPDEANPAAEESHPLHALHGGLRAAGDELLRAVDAWKEPGATPPTAAQIRTLARTLGLLCDLGWAPRATLKEELTAAVQQGNPAQGPKVLGKGQDAVSDLWRALADAAPAAGLPASERRRLLLRALRHARSPRLAERLRAAIARMDGPAA